MKRRYLNKKPGIGDFKSKCSKLVSMYDANSIRIIYEVIQEKALWNQAFLGYPKKTIIHEIKKVLKKQKVSIFHLEKIVTEIFEYFEKSYFLTDCKNIREN